MSLFLETILYFLLCINIYELTTGINPVSRKHMFLITIEGRDAYYLERSSREVRPYRDSHYNLYKLPPSSLLRKVVAGEEMRTGNSDTCVLRDVGVTSSKILS